MRMSSLHRPSVVESYEEGDTPDPFRCTDPVAAVTRLLRLMILFQGLNLIATLALLAR